MNSKFTRQVIFPIAAAVIWGTALVFQSEGAEFVGPLTFNALRSAVAAIALALLWLVRALITKRRAKSMLTEAQPPKRNRKALLWGGFLCGTMLAIASNLQQLGLGETSPGKAAFITALYVVLVPVLGVFLGKRVQPIIWGSVALAAAGLYFLCITGDLGIEASDLFIFLCALCFACHILVIDRFSPHVDGIELSCVQFIVMAVESAVGMLLFENPTVAGVTACLGSVVYVGLFSSGVGFTLQILAQQNSNPTVVSLLLSLESVFSVLAMGLMMGQWLSTREWIGCGLMLAAVVLAKLPVGVPNKKKSV